MSLRAMSFNNVKEDAMGEAKRRQAEIERLKRATGATEKKKDEFVITVSERGLAEHIDEVRQAMRDNPFLTVLIFPESLRDEAVKAFPAAEYVNTMHSYCRAHPDLELEVFKP
jgi:hypothetical protein